jgi:hypothetical protein
MSTTPSRMLHRDESLRLECALARLGNEDEARFADA